MKCLRRAAREHVTQNPADVTKTPGLKSTDRLFFLCENEI